MLVRRNHWIPIASAALLGVGALALLPGQGQQVQPAVANEDPVFPPPALVKTETSASIVPAGTKPPEAETLVSSTKVEAEPAAAQAQAFKAATEVAVASLPDDPSATASTAISTTSTGPWRPLRVGSQAVNVRAEANTASDKLFVLQPGQEVSVDSAADGWMHITVAGGASGWVYSPYLEAGEAQVADLQDALPIVDGPPRAAPPKRTKPAVRAVVQGADDGDLEGRTARIGTPLPAKARPSDSAPTAVMLDSGERVRIAESRNGWLRVVTEDGTSVWIQRAL